MGRKDKADADGAEDVEAKAKGKGKGNLIPAVVIAVGLLGGGYLMSSGKSAKAATPPAAPGSPAGATHAAAGAGTGPGTPSHGPTTTIAEGAIVKLDDITLNLADGRFLKVGLAFQLSKKGKADTFTTESPKALDLAIAVLGDRTYSQLIAPGGREAAKAELTEKVKKEYPAAVLDVYFTDFVMQ